jgi:ABC-type lipoprotein release transport system permease subunit
VDPKTIDALELYLGLGALISYMLFIIWRLARDSKAGRFGTFVLFFVLAFGMVGFIAKEIMVFFMER